MAAAGQALPLVAPDCASTPLHHRRGKILYCWCADLLPNTGVGHRNVQAPKAPLGGFDVRRQGCLHRQEYRKRPRRLFTQAVAEAQPAVAMRNNFVFQALREPRLALTLPIVGLNTSIVASVISGPIPSPASTPILNSR